MGFGAKGVSGEIRLGGRTAVELTTWNLETLPEEGGWQIRADIRPETADDYLLEQDGRFELRLNVGTRIWRFRHVDITVNGAATIRGDGAPDVFERDED